MPKLENKIKVRSKSADENGGKRRFIVELESETGMFALSDVLILEGVIEPLEMALKKVCKQTLLAYFSEARELVRGIGKSRTETPKA